MAKNIIFDNDARQKLKIGIDKLANAVKTTLGPKGNDVVIASYYSDNKPHITKDGVTVAKNIEFEDPIENAGACIIREAALKTVNACGDATTTSIVLSQALVDKAEDVLKEIDPVSLRQQIENITPNVLKKIESKIIPIEENDLERIATISANNDPIIGKLIGTAYKEVGKEGIVLVEESKSVNTYNEIIMGMQFENGYLANHFITDQVKEQCILNNPYILLTEHKIENTRDLLNILNPIAKEKGTLLIIAQDFEDSVIENFKLNHLQGIIKCCLVKAPSFGQYRNSLLKDISVICGGTVLSYDSGLALNDIDFSFLGKCEKVIISKDKTTLIKGAGTKEEIQHYAETLKHQLTKIEEDPSLEGSFDEKFLKERLAKLLGGICTIHVGGTTELEMKERMDRVEDAVCAVKAALQTGIVRGGGVTYRDIANLITPESLGEKVIKEALLVPYNTLIHNAGLTEIDSITENSGYNLTNNTYCEDVLNAGIIDPAKACIQAFENAISVVKLYLSSSCVVYPLPSITVI